MNHDPLLIKMTPLFLHRGTVFLFNVARQNYVILPERIKKCSCIRFHPSPKHKELIAGTKDGSLLLMEYCGINRTPISARQWTHSHFPINYTSRPSFFSELCASNCLIDFPPPPTQDSLAHDVISTNLMVSFSGGQYHHHQPRLRSIRLVHRRPEGNIRSVLDKGAASCNCKDKVENSTVSFGRKSDN